VNGDGVRDFAIGATHANLESGYVRIYSGATRGLLRTIPGSVPFSQFGSSIAQTGDLDVDLVGDIVIGAPNDSGGLVYAYSPASGVKLWSVGPAQAGDHFGLSLAGIDDYDGDGLDDVLAGAPDADTEAGKVYLLSGDDGATLDVVLGDEDFDNLGASVARADDVDGDGVADIAIGVPGADFTGRLDAGAMVLRSGVDLSFLSRCKGPAAGAALGGALAPAGDVNSDGIPDLVCGAKLADGGGATEAGSAHVLSCQRLPLHTEGVVISAASGGRARLELDAGVGNALRRYWILASPNGMWPGVEIGALHVPLNDVGIGQFYSKASQSPMFQRFRGELDSEGRARAAFRTMGPLDPALVGLRVHFAFVLLDPIDFASNALPIEIVP